MAGSKPAALPLGDAPVSGAMSASCWPLHERAEIYQVSFRQETPIQINILQKQPVATWQPLATP
jgi:hypothetical protein